MWLTLFKYMLVIKNRPSKMNFFGVKEFFFVNFDFKNECKNEFKNNNEKSCSRFKNRILEPIGLTSPSRQTGS